MRVIVQRVSSASVTIKHRVHAAIEKGLLVLIGIEGTDTDEDINWLSEKISGLRIFSDREGKMNLDVKIIQGDVLVISQFTLHASTKKGNRPSFLQAAKPDIAIPLYEKFLLRLSSAIGKKVQSGVFGADMAVSLVNNGPVTIFIDTKNKE